MLTAGKAALPLLVFSLPFTKHGVMIGGLQTMATVRIGLGFAWLNANAYQGLTGSYEDARHLWLLLGLLIVAVRLEPHTQADGAA